MLMTMALQCVGAMRSQVAPLECLSVFSLNINISEDNIHLLRTFAVIKPDMIH